MKPAYSLSEIEVAARLPGLLAQKRLTLIDTEVRIGAFRLDAVAFDPDGCLVIVELKTTRWIGTLAQLLLYPRALKKSLAAKGIQPPPIRCLLVTTFLDRGVLDLIADYELSDTVDVLVCSGSLPDDLKLTPPLHEDAADVVLDQADGPACIDKVASWIGQQSA